MLWPFPNWPSSCWKQCRRNYIPTINIVISVSVCTEKKRVGDDEISFTKEGRVCRPVAGTKYMYGY